MEDILNSIKDYVFDAAECVDMPEAVAMGLNHRDMEITGKSIASCSDVYSLIENISDDQVFKSFDYLAIISTGWAAPLNETKDLPPSQAPSRRRVTLIIASDNLTQKVMGSVIVFHDDMENPVFDLGEADGPLNSALLSLY